MRPIYNPSPVSVLIFSILTCGIYYIYWTFKFNSAINRISEDNQVSSGLVILALLCFPLHIYLFWLYGKKLHAYKQAKHPEAIVSDQSMVLAVFGFLFVIVSAMIAQGELNEIYAEEGYLASTI